MITGWSSPPSNCMLDEEPTETPMVQNDFSVDQWCQRSGCGPSRRVRKHARGRQRVAAVPAKANLTVVACTVSGIAVDLSLVICQDFSVSHVFTRVSPFTQFGSDWHRSVELPLPPIGQSRIVFVRRIASRHAARQLDVATGTTQWRPNQIGQRGWGGCHAAMR